MTPDGEAQARRLRRRLLQLGMSFRHVWTSPLRRASDTCALTGFADVNVVERDLREWDCGDYEGLTLEEIQAKRPGWNLFRDGCPGGELPAQIAERANAIVDRLRNIADPVVLFSHGHFLCALAARWIGLSVSDGARFRLDAAAFGVRDGEHETAAGPTIAPANVGEQLARASTQPIETDDRRCGPMRLAS